MLSKSDLKKKRSKNKNDLEMRRLKNLRELGMTRSLKVKLSKKLISLFNKIKLFQFLYFKSSAKSSLTRPSS